MRIDPRVKLLIIVILTSIAVFALDIVYLAAVFIISLLFNIILKAKLFSAFKRLKHLLSLIIFIAVMQSLSVKGGIALVSIGKITLITSGGLLNGAEFALRMGIIIFASLIASTEEGRGMVDALIKLKVPYELAFMVSIALRFIPMFSEEFKSRLNAIKLRGIDIVKLNIVRKIKLYTYLLTPTVSGAIIKSRCLATAMEARAFRAYSKRTMLNNLRLNFVDYVFIIIIIGILTAFITMSFTTGGIL